MANRISLDIIFSSPFFWKSGKICDFFTAAHKYIQDTSDERCKIFKEKLDSEAQSPTWNLWNGKANWRNVFEKEQFKLVTTYLEAGNADKLNNNYKPKKKYWQIRSVVELLGIIRNKHEHNGRYSDEAKKKLKWFQFVSGNFQFDPSLYAKYWIDKFPNLALFLWIHFCKFRDVPTLSSFYPCDLTSQHDEYSYLPHLMSGLKDALQDQMDTGAVLDRYVAKCDQISISLEFRSFSADKITQLLDGSLSLHSRICENHVSCHWMNQTAKIDGLQCNQVMDHLLSDTYITCVTCVFANTIADLSDNMFKEIDNCHCGSLGTRVIVFTSSDPENIYEFKYKCNQWATTHFGYVSEYPVSFEDVSPSIQDIVKKQSKVCMQRSKDKLSKLLPKNVNMKTQCLKSLSGNVLNTILKGGTPKIFGKLVIPNLPSFYIKRSLQSTVVINVEVLKHASLKNIFICLGLDKEHLKHMTKCEVADITEIDVLPNDLKGFSKFIIIRNCELNEIGKTLTVNKNKNIHVVRFLQEQGFEWIETHGSTKILDQNCKHFKDDIIPKSEAEFLKSLQAINKQEKLVLIADKPGMGKSVIMASFATQLAEKFSDRLVIHLSVNEFVKELVQFLPLSESSIVSLLSQLTSDTEFERTLIYGWLHDSKTSSKPKIELMLDGLDETSDKNKELVTDAVTILLHCFTAVRVWITLRTHMLNELASKFGTYGYKLLPLSLDDQSELIVQHWKKYSNQNCEAVIEKYKKFATQCLQLQSLTKKTEITGIPLLCRMIAEIYENKILQQDFTLCSNTTLSELYNNMFERKLEIYLKNKCDLSTLAMQHVIANTMRENLEKWNLYFAIKLIFSEQVSTKFINLLQTECSSQDEIKEAVLQFGLIDKLHPLTFIHRTFAEFLVGRFAFKILSKKIVQFSQDFLEEFVQKEVFRFEIHKTKISNQIIAMFWDPQPVCKLSYPIVNYFLNDLMQTTCEKNELCSKSTDLLWGLFNHEVTGLGFGETFINISPLMAATCHSKLRSLFSYFLHNGQNLKGMFVLCLLSRNFQSVIDIINLGKYFQPETWHGLRSFDSNKFGIVHWSIHSLCHKHFLSDGERFLKFFKFIFSERPDAFEERDKNGFTPLLLLVKTNYALWDTYFDMMNLLLYELLVNVHQTSFDNNTVIHFLSPITPDKIGNISIHYTDIHILHKYRILLSTFLQDESNRYMLNVKNSSGHTPLLSLIHAFKEHRNYSLFYREYKDSKLGDYFLSKRYEEFCKTMVNTLRVFWKYGADFNVKFTDGRTALHFAIDQFFKRNVVLALAKVGNIYAKNNEGQCALHLSILQKEPYIFAWLVINRGGDLSVCDCQGTSVLDLGVLQFIFHNAWQTFKGTLDQTIIDDIHNVFKYVVETYPSSLEMQDSLGRTPLHVLLQEGLHIATVELYEVFASLVYFFVKTLKANVNAVDKNGDTVLHFQTIKVFDNCKPLDPVKYLKVIKAWRSILCTMLKSRFQKNTLNLTNRQGKASLTVIMETFSNHPILVGKALKIFHKVGANFETTDVNGNTLLMLAIKEGHDIKIVHNLILKYNANTNDVNLRGECALTMAIRKKNIEVLKLLLQHCQLLHLINKRKMLMY